MGNAVQFHDRAHACLGAVLIGALLAPPAPAQHVINGRPFYEYEIPLATGDTIPGPGGQSFLIADLWPNLGLNNHGQLAVPGQVILNGASNAAVVVYEDSPNNQLQLHLSTIWNDGVDWADYLSVITYAAINDAGEFVYDTDSLGIGPWGTFIRFTDGSKKFLFCDRESPTSNRVMAHRHPDISDDGYVVAQGIEVRPIWTQPTNWLMSSPPTSPLLYEGTARESYPVLRLSSNEAMSDVYCPVVAHGGVKAVLAGWPTNGTVYRFNAAGTQQALATAPGDFEWLGTRVGLSGDGQAAVFLGRRADGVEGIFLSLFGSGFVLPDLATPILDTSTAFAVTSAGEPIKFSKILTSNGLFVAFQDRNADGQLLGSGDLEGDSLLVAFVAEPNQASRNNAAAGQAMFFKNLPGIWVARFDLQRGMTSAGSRLVNLRTVTPVAQLGDLLDGEQILDLYLAGFGQATREADGAPRRTADGRPELGDHVVAFHASTASKSYAVKAYHLDTDGDGLLDHWERAGGGIDMVGDGTLDLDLAALGADDRHKDLFVELDWTAARPYWTYPGGWRNEPTRAELEKLRDRFQAAPVSNPDGLSGIRLHVDAGVGLSVGGMRWAPLPMLRGGDIVTTSDGQRPAQVAVDPDNEYFGDTQYTVFRTAKLNDIKERHFMNAARGARELAFRYGVLADYARLVRWSGESVHEHIFRVVSADRRQIIGTTDLIIPDTNSPPQKAVLSVAILEGPAAGQVRRMQYFNPPGGFEGYPGRFLLKCHSNEVDLFTLPNAGNSFVLGSGYAGDSEVFVYTNANNLHRLPGNDFVVTLGAWGTRPDGGLGNESKVWRTLMHELGHTMGLVHGGREANCAFKGVQHLSRMSYSHSDRAFTNDPMPVYSNGCGSAVIDLTNGLPATLVNSYSDGTDPEGLDEYAYLRLAPWGTPWLLGNTLLTLDAPLRSAHSAGEPDPGAPPFEPDREGPRIVLPAPAARTAALGSPLTVIFEAQDAAGVEGIAVRFDLNGDGVITNGVEQVAATPLGGDQYQALFSNVTGTATGRVLEIAATDQRGNASKVRAVYRVGGISLADTTAPSTYFLDCCPATLAAGAPHDIRIQVSGEGTGPLDGISSLECFFDANGDGVTNALTERTTAGLGEDGYWRTRIGPLSGAPGGRRLRVVAEDLAGNRSTNSAVFTVIAADAGPPVIVAIGLTNLMVVPLGPTGLTVPMTVRDDQCLTSARLYFDRNGDGTNALVESSVQTFYFCETNASFNLTMGSGGITGSSGVRTASVTVADAYGRQTTAVFAVQVADTRGPQVTVAGPLFDAIIRPGTNFAVTGSAIDDQRVTNVIVRVDLDGDGLFTGPGEVVNLGTNSPAAFSASFAGFTGAYGERRVRIEAVDPLGQTTVCDYFVQLAPGLRAWAPLAGDQVSAGASVLAVVEAPGATNLVMALDLNGDGDRADVGESVTGAVRTINVQAVAAIRVTEAVLGTLEGPPGTRELWVTGFDAAGGPLSLQVPLQVTNDALFASARSRRVGGLPAHPDPVTVQGAPTEPYPSLLTPFGSNLLYVARTPTEGEALWRSDGTRAGTRLLKDANPERWTGGVDVGQPASMGISQFMEFQGRVFFNAQDREGGAFSGSSGQGNELWATDGTVTGTVLVKDIHPSGDSEPSSFAVYSNVLYFAATTPGAGRELWSSDGTRAGTTLFADIVPGASGSLPQQLVVHGGQLWFVASVDELWRTDGTLTGTVRIADLPLVGAFSQPISQLTPVGSRLFFTHSDAAGEELWTSDGTATGTVRVADLYPGSTGSSPKRLFAFSNLLWFVANTASAGNELWLSDGTTGGTRQVRDIWPGTSSAQPNNFTVHGGRLWFNAWNSTYGDELWSTDGTGDGLRREPEIGRISGSGAINGADLAPTANPTSLLSLASTLYLQANDGGGRYGAELWRIDSNGLPRLVRDTSPIYAHRYIPLTFSYYDGPDRGAPTLIRNAGGRLFFRGRDSLYGNQLFTSDGTGTGTRRLGGRVRSWTIPESADWGGAPHFAVATGKGARWMRMNGASLDTLPLPLPTGVTVPSNVVASGNGIAFEGSLVDPLGFPYIVVLVVPTPGAAPVQVMQLNDCWRIFPAGNGWLFTGRDTNNVDRLWCTDGSPSGTHVLTNINVSFGNGFPSSLVQLGGKTLFNMGVTQAMEVWVSDATPAGTRRVRAAGTGETLAYGRDFSVNGPRVGFFAAASDNIYRFWVLPDINADAQAVAELSQASYPEPPVLLNGRWVFSAFSSATNTPLWISDGTATGTVGFGSVASSSYPLGRMVESPRRLRVIGSNVYFAAAYGFDGEEPFVSDGTVGGTRGLGNLYRLPSAGANPGSSPRLFTPLGSWVLFAATDKDHGEELWRTDGTEEGTIFLKDIFPGLPSGELADLTAVSNRIYFTARDPDHGRELWSTDGTSQGTLMIEDLVPGPGSSDPLTLRLLGTNLCFFALDGAEDHSLRALNNTAAPPTPYEQWLAGYSLPGSFAGQPWEDGDGDGWSNEMEHLFDTSPTEAGSAHALRGMGVQRDGIDYLVMKYSRPANWRDLGLWFQFDGCRYLPLFYEVAGNEVAVETNGNFETVTVRVWTEGADAYFIRLRVRRD